MNKKPWYEDTMKYELPKFVNTMKELLQERLSLQNKKKEIVTRLRNGVEFFKNPNNDRGMLVQGAARFYDLAKELVCIQERIQEIEVQLTSIIEGKLSKLGFIINIPKGENEDEVMIDSRKVTCVPWASVFKDEEHVVMTPEEIWFFGMARKLFNCNPNNIEFVPPDKLEDLLNNIATDK